MEIIQDIKVLSKPCSSISVSKGMEIGKLLIEELKNNQNKWIGIAANQLGIDARVFAIALQGNFTGEYKYLVNPIIINTSDETFIFREGCLSFPGKPCRTTRYKYVIVECDNYESKLYFGPSGLHDDTKGTWEEETRKQDDELKLLESVCVQHEIDHLNGLRILDRTYEMKPIKVKPKFGRNEIVPITDGKTYKEIKYKKALPLIESGKWEIYVPANAEIYETQE